MQHFLNTSLIGSPPQTISTSTVDKLVQATHSGGIPPQITCDDVMLTILGRSSLSKRYCCYALSGFRTDGLSIKSIVQKAAESNPDEPGISDKVYEAIQYSQRWREIVAFTSQNSDHKLTGILNILLPGSP